MVGIMATDANVLAALEERRSVRRPVGLAVSISNAVEPTPMAARLADLSEHGCRLETSGPEVIGRLVTVALPNSIALKGWVAWAGQRGVGVTFANPIFPLAVERITSGKAD